jgi:metallo-beta-lactamase class B
MRAVALIIAFILSFQGVWSQAEEKRLQITPLTGDFYIYTTFNSYEGSRVPAHGMYLLTSDGVVLFDTPWDTTQFQPLLDSIQSRHQQHVTVCIATHWHSDRTEGLAYYRRKGIKTYTTSRTDRLSQENNKKRAEHLMTKDTVFNPGQYSFQVYYPGEGHTSDNIVVWFDSARILYGGCLIKGVEAENLGYLGDANVSAYETTLRNVQRKCPSPKYIIVSHHDWTNNKSLEHSIELAKKLRK